MDMKILKNEKRICTCCMEEHEVKTVLLIENTTFKNVKVDYEAQYLYCDATEEFYMNEQQIQENDIRIKDAYRRNQGLLTSSEICSIRSKYGISQSDLCILLGWGEKTITRYEGHQVQDKAHDTILKKIDVDSEWFLKLLNESKDNFSEESYQKYLEVATNLYEKDHDVYLRKAIEASYARFQGNKLFHGNTELSLSKVVDVIRYFASSNEITDLYKSKLMRLMWYADALSFRSRGFAMTGLVYKAMPMGVVPIGHNSIIDLRDVPCEEVDMGETIVYHFSLKENTVFPTLTEDDKKVLDDVINKLGKLTKNQIISIMCNEQVYVDSISKDIIQFR